jgi:hypothetical protein
MRIRCTVAAFAVCALTSGLAGAQSRARPPAADADAGFVSIFNGRDLTGWQVPDGDGGHWKVVDGVIDYDAQSEAAGEKHLWTAKAYRDFTLRFEWRFKDAPFPYTTGRILLPDGTEKTGADGKPVAVSFPDADSGILLRGSQHQVNLWCWPAGSGELWSIRRDLKLPQAVRAAATPRLHADKNIGEWNQMEVTLRGDRVTVVLNGHTVIENALFPGLAASGPIGFQHHGGMKDGTWTSSPSLIQLRNIRVKELANSRS